MNHQPFMSSHSYSKKEYDLTMNDSEDYTSLIIEAHEMASYAFDMVNTILEVN